MSANVRLSGLILVVIVLMSLSGCCTFRSCEVKDTIAISAITRPPPTPSRSFGFALTFAVQRR